MAITLIRVSTITGVLLMLHGCSIMNGIGGSATLSCKAPDGVACNSLSGTYENSLQDNLPGQRMTAAPDEGIDQIREEPKSQSWIVNLLGVKHSQEAQEEGHDRHPESVTAKSVVAKNEREQSVSPVNVVTPTSGMPVRTLPTVLRIWIAPWEDADGDLHDQHYIYTTLNDARWKIEVNQEQIRSQFRPVVRKVTQTKNGDPKTNSNNDDASSKE